MKFDTPKSFSIVVICMIFTIIGLVVVFEDIWVSILIFGCIVLIISYSIKKVKSSLVPDTDLLLNFHNTGFTNYRDGGFNNKSSEKRFYWNEIIKITAFKIDRISFDDICIVCNFRNGFAFIISEETPGWDEFLKHMEINLAVMPNWLEKVVLPEFARNETVIYEQ